MWTGGFGCTAVNEKNHHMKIVINVSKQASSSFSNIKTNGKTSAGKYETYFFFFYFYFYLFIYLFFIYFIYILFWFIFF
jgi:hypothetical protein